MPPSLHLNLDEAWSNDTAGLQTLAALNWGPQLRFSAPSKTLEAFYREHEARLAPFILYGSGDFHHLSALWVRRVKEDRLVVVSFDNHPDWDIRPPKWCCGSWVNRALEVPQVRRISVWGCGNFECWWPGQVFGNRRAEREGKLEVHAWADGQSSAKRKRRGVIFRATWREHFADFVKQLRGGPVYVTVDLDCLQAEEAATNWENGRFTVEDIAWAIERLRSETHVVSGDICGAFSPPRYARWGQRFIAEMDHPKLPPWEETHARTMNRAAVEKLWPLLAGT